MKNLYPFLILLFLSLSIYAQSPEKMSYQAVVRDANNILIANKTIGMQISILQSTITGTVVYSETHSVDTNINGLVSLEIGTGSTSDNFSEIDWSVVGPYFIKTETDPTGGDTYSITGINQLLSVPFALYAKNSGSSETNATNIANNTTSIEKNTIAITLNTAKVGITAQQASDITSNNAKTVITTEQSDAIVTNTAKSGITSAQASAITDNTAKSGITSDQATAIGENTAKVGYTEAAVTANTDVAANTLKVGITAQQASDITSNNAKTVITTEQSDAIVTNTAKSGITSAQASAIANNTAKSGITSDQATAIGENTAKVGYTEAAVSANTDVAANTAKTGITSDQAGAIVANTEKIGYTEALVSANTDVAANTAKTGITSDQADAIVANSSSSIIAISFWSDTNDVYGRGTAPIPLLAVVDHLAMYGQVPGTPILPHGMGSYYNTVGRAIDGVLRGYPSTYGEHMAYKGSIVGAAINMHVAAGIYQSFKIYAVNYGGITSPPPMPVALIGTYSGTDLFTGSLRNTSNSSWGSVHTGFGSGGGAASGPLIDYSTGAPIAIQPGDWIGIYIDSGSIPPRCVIEGTLYVKINNYDIWD